MNMGTKILKKCVKSLSKIGWNYGTKKRMKKLSDYFCLYKIVYKIAAHSKII